MLQSVSSVFMVRPAVFYSNPETAASNAFQQGGNILPDLETVWSEFDALVFALQNEGVQVHVFQDTAHPPKPDALFPNNWVGLHENGIRVYYPMEASNRRIEKNEAVCSFIDQIAPSIETVDYTGAVSENCYLEGTGSLIFDYLNKRVFASLSSRTNDVLALEVAKHLGYEPVIFNAFDANKTAYYHTNVLLSIGTRFAIVCSEAIPTEQRKKVLDSLAFEGRTIIEITRNQVNAFAGNVLELRNYLDELLIVISSVALDALSGEQLAVLQRSGLLIAANIPTIEKFGGGSVRCMLAEIRWIQHNN